MITLKNLSLQRGTKLIFERVNLTIYAGQKVGVVGANGCGKSTLFALFLDEIHPDAGDLELHGAGPRRRAHARHRAQHGAQAPDRVPGRGELPTTLWTPGEVISDTHRIVLPPDLPPGRYRLKAGLFTMADGAFFNLPTDPATPDNQVDLGAVNLP